LSAYRDASSSRTRLSYASSSQSWRGDKRTAARPTPKALTRPLPTKRRGEETVGARNCGNAPNPTQWRRLECRTPRPCRLAIFAPLETAYGPRRAHDNARALAPAASIRRSSRPRSRGVARFANGFVTKSSTTSREVMLHELSRHAAKPRDSASILLNSCVCYQ